jgi:hypothetical protein
VPLRVLLVSVVLSVAALGGVGHASVATASAPPATDAPVDTAPEPTFNEFFPENQPISDCISAAPKPGCGSESRSDYHQWLVFIALVGGMAFVGWRVVAGARRGRPVTDTNPNETKANEPVDR